MATCSYVVLTVIFIFHLSAGACPTNCKQEQKCDAADSGCPQCEQAYYGRTCQHRLECRFTTKGAEYRGKRSTTVNGRTCQRWDTETPHSNLVKSPILEENYCRNSDNIDQPWCYTTDSGKRWEYCAVPLCGNQCFAPLLSSSGVDILNPPPDGFSVGFYAVIGCMTGYEALTQPSIATMKCKNDRTWTQSPLPACSRVQCSSLTHAHFKIINPQPTYEYQENITIECHAGYTLQGQNTFVCQADKSWGPSLPACNINECSAPGPVPNGFILETKAKYVFQDTVTVICNNGYVLTGMDKMKCLANKTWSSSPTCEKDCPSNCKTGNTCDAVDSGCPECQEAYYGRQCQHRMECIFTSKGAEYRGKRNITANKRTCQRWNSGTPHGSYFRHLEENYCRNPDNEPGPWCYTTDRNVRWELCGVLSCSAQCLSPQLQSPGVDIINPPSDGFVVGFNAIIGCMTGYEASVPPATVSVICGNDKKWTESLLAACKKVQCPSPILKPNSRIVHSEFKYEYQDKIGIVCDIGYTLQGQSTLSCQADKSWNSSFPTCNKVQCPLLTPTINSEIINPQSKYEYQDSITIVCETGYTMQGQGTLVCEADASWRPSLPTCHEVQCPLPATTPNSRIMNPQSRYQYQQDISIACDTGYTLQGQNTLTCQADKSWSTSLPSCSINECRDPGTVPNSSMLGTKATYVYQDTITIKCDTGYTLSGEEQMTCQADKTWSDAPACKINECPEPEKVLNSSVVETKDKYKYQDTVTIKCNVGYTLRGQDVIICQANETWSSTPTCEINECTAPGKIANGSILETKAKHVYQDTVTIKCNTGYTRKGLEKMTCQANKTWNDAPICAINECQKPVINNGSVSTSTSKPIYQYKDKIAIDCDVGYTLQGRAKLRCQADKTWGALPNCTINKCQKPFIGDGFYSPSKQTYQYQDKIVTKCDVGYTLQGEAELICEADKTWGALPNCTINKCASPLLNAQSSIGIGKMKSVYVYTETINIVCDTGYTLLGESNVTCQANKRWSSSMPTCEINKCPSLRLIPNSNIRNSSAVYRYNDVIAIKCNAGYILQGSTHLTCQANKTWNMKPPTCEEETMSVAAIAGGVVGSVTVIALVIVVVFIVCRSRLSKKEENRSTTIMAFQDIEKLDEIIKEAATDNVYANTSTGADETENTYYNIEEIKHAGRIHIANLKDYMRLKNNENFLQEKFQGLLFGLQRPTEEAMKPKNRPKNKYKNIYPYDDNRICLKKLPSVPNSDYINASPIKGYDGNIKYIAAQGPQELTYCDFWRMVVEQNIRKIVMLTNPFENAVKKCIQYWPDEESVTAGTITIDLQSSDKFADYTVRRLKVSKDGDTSFVHQYHFNTWPDKGVPKCPSVLAEFHRKVCDMPVVGSGPLLIHCSAGIGRTGTFIALDYLLDEASATGSVDVRTALEIIREQRVNMVQTKDQYIFLHYVLIDALELRSCTIMAAKFSEKYKGMLARNKAPGKTPLQLEYESMKESVSYPIEDAALTGKREANKKKNRYNDILPTDANRVFLSGSDIDDSYINAVYLPGYRDSRAYIITQTPMSNTMGHFWKLVYDENITSVVMMNQETNPEEQYWPDDENTPKEFGGITINLLSNEAETNFRTLSLEICRKNEKHVVKQYQVLFWPDTDPAPKTTFPMLQLIERIQEWAHQNESRPILIHCMNGADKSGMLSSAMAILDKLKNEQDVCIQPIIKQFRTIRPQIIPNMDQFRFCYDLAAAYIDSFETYSNFI